MFLYICCVLVLLIHQKRALWVTKLVPIKGEEEQLNVCNHVACRLCLLLAFDANKSLNCNFWNLALLESGSSCLLGLETLQNWEEAFTFMNERWLQLLHFLRHSCHVLVSLRYPLMFG